MDRFGPILLEEQPCALALIVCDRIIIDAATQKRSLIDLFTSITLPELPCVSPRICIFASAARGTADVQEIYLGLFAPNGEAILRSALKLEWGAEGAIDFIVQMQPVILQEAGFYDLRLFVAEHVLAQRQIDVQIAPQPPPEAQTEPPTP